MLQSMGVAKSRTRPSDRTELRLRGTAPLLPRQLGGVRLGFWGSAPGLCWKVLVTRF